MESTPTLPAIQRRLVLIRHAKAVEADTAGDMARPLSERGRGDALALGQWLVEHGIQPDLILCSAAARTRETLSGMGVYAPTILSEKLYLAMPGEMLSQIQAVEPAVKTLMVIGHNPGIHAALGMLVGSYAHEADAERMALKFPTSACALLSVSLTSWRELTPATAKLELLKI